MVMNVLLSTCSHGWWSLGKMIGDCNLSRIEGVSSCPPHSSVPGDGGGGWSSVPPAK